MKVSVCMITYNQDKFIEQAIESVLAQRTNYSFELVIGEDSSSDNTKTICEDFAQRFPGKIRLLPSDKRYGMMDNFIRTLNACKGEYIAFLEGDDYWCDENKLERQAFFLQNNPDYSGVSGGVRIFYENRGEFCYPDDVKRLGYDYDITLGSYLSGNAAYFPALMTRKSLIIRNEISDYSFGDIVIQTTILQTGFIRHLEGVFTVYRRHYGGVTNSLFIKTKERVFADLILLFERLNAATHYKYDKIITKRLFDYRICYRFSKQNLSLWKKIWLVVFSFFSNSFLKTPSIQKTKTILSVAFKNSYPWAIT